MAEFKDLLQTADWKKEKHVPVIEAQDKVKKGESLKISVSVGKEIAHPNTTEHHIAWIKVYFLPEGEKFPYQIGECYFSTHGESIQGPNTSTVYSNPEATIVMKTDKSGLIYTISYCNIHGLWQNSKQLIVG
ncbi:MAG: hypothetical protein C4533_00915 [Candidatus Omnitrophota bacterium]|jgi:superoxide reductase|nr:MAG: hypothetical protein C4533_00915 [Candidatus Omnitrophota bacterium]